MPDKLSSLSIPDMPNDDQGAYYWLANFAEALGREREALGGGVSSDLCQTIAQRVKAFHEAYDLASRPTTRTSPNIAAKTQARNEAVRAVREALKIINENPDISEAQRVSLGLKPLLDRRMRPINRRSPHARRAADAF